MTVVWSTATIAYFHLHRHICIYYNILLANKCHVNAYRQTKLKTFPCCFLSSRSLNLNDSIPYAVYEIMEERAKIYKYCRQKIYIGIYICVYSVLHRSVNDIYVKWISVFSFSSAAMPAIELVCHVPSIKIFPSFYTWMGLNRLKCIYIYIIYHAMSPSQKFSLLLAFLSTTNITTNIICPSFYIYIYVQNVYVRVVYIFIICSSSCQWNLNLWIYSSWAHSLY